MKNFIGIDRLNPNAISARYGRPAEECNRYRAAGPAFQASVLEKGVIDHAPYLPGYNPPCYGRVNGVFLRTKDYYRLSGNKGWISTEDLVGVKAYQVLML